MFQQPLYPSSFTPKRSNESQWEGLILHLEDSRLPSCCLMAGGPLGPLLQHHQAMWGYVHSFYKCLTGTALTKPSKGKVRPHAMQESMACMSELGYSAKLTLNLSQVHSAKLWSSHCYLAAIWLFGNFAELTSPVHQVHLAVSPSSHCKVASTPHHQGGIANLPKFCFILWTAQIFFQAAKDFKSMWAVQYLSLLLLCPSVCPQKETPHNFKISHAVCLIQKGFNLHAHFVF